MSGPIAPPASDRISSLRVAIFAFGAVPLQMTIGTAIVAFPVIRSLALAIPILATFAPFHDPNEIVLMFRVLGKVVLHR